VSSTRPPRTRTRPYHSYSPQQRYGTACPSHPCYHISNLPLPYPLSSYSPSSPSATLHPPPVLLHACCPPLPAALPATTTASLPWPASATACPSPAHTLATLVATSTSCRWRATAQTPSCTFHDSETAPSRSRSALTPRRHNCPPREPCSAPPLGAPVAQAFCLPVPFTSSLATTAAACHLHRLLDS
jgi:hypothetical protein